MIIFNHALGDGHHYTATAAIVGVEVVSYPTGSGFAVLVKLANGCTEVIVDGREADVNISKLKPCVTWSAP
jgi:hypothetical protein